MRKRNTYLFLWTVTILLLLSSCASPESSSPSEEGNESTDRSALYIDTLKIKAVDEGEVIFYSSQDYYRYGPSILKNEDGSYDAWFSAPGNNNTEWDWITYRHSDDGVNWSGEKTVLRPTPGSKDQCSVCDPGVIYFGGYYYMGYTSTDYYEGKGSSNSAFVARSEYPDGPFEKWNGSGWGGDPEPIIYYDGEPEGWGIGEISFVINGEDLCIYYTYYDMNGGYTGLYKADLVENWPETMRSKGPVLLRDYQDSLDVVYDDVLGVYFGFSVYQRMAINSCLIMYVSKDGKSFEEADTTKDMIENYSHNVGVAKNMYGHISSDEPILVGYAFGERWGRWDTRFQYINISY